MPETAEKPSTDARKVTGVYVSYYSDVENDLTGETQRVLLTANRGAVIELSEAEQARLDALGMLEEPGVDGEKVRKDLNDRYRAARGDQSAAELVMSRALSPDDNVQPGQVRPEQPSASPTPGGQPPRGDLVTGDTGAPDVAPTPLNVLESAGAGPDVVRLDAPDVRECSVAELAAWIEAEKPTVSDTVGLAEDDPALAAKVLEAETVATGGDPRAGVAKKLSSLTSE